MAKITTPSDTTVLALHGRLSVVDDATLTQSPVPEASSTASRTRLERTGHISQSTPPGGDSGSSLGLLCLDELSAMSLLAADGDSVRQGRGGAQSVVDARPLPSATSSRAVQGPVDSSDNESNTSDTMMPVVRLADEELQRLAEDLSDFEGNSLLLSSDEYDESERADGHSSNGGHQAYYDLGSHQDGDGVEEPREAGAGRYSSEEDDGDGDGRHALDSRIRSSSNNHSSSAEGAASTSQGGMHGSSTAAAAAASTSAEMPPPLSRPDLVGSSSGSRGPAFHSASGSAYESSSGGGVDLRNADTVRQRAEGRSVESGGGLAGPSALLASPAQAHGSLHWSSLYSQFEPDNPEAQRRVRPMGDDLLSRQRLPVTSAGNKAAAFCALAGGGGVRQRAASNGASRIVSSDEEQEVPVSGAGERDGSSPTQGEGCETSQQLASRYILPGTADDDDDDDAGNVAMSSASEVTLTGFLHSPATSIAEPPSGFMASLADQQGLDDYVGSEAFKSGASALDMLRQDDCFHLDSKTTSALSEGSMASWVPDAGSGGGMSSISIGQYMAARTEALGSLSGQANQRPRFGDGSLASPPVGAPRRLLLPDNSASQSAVFNASSTVASNWQGGLHGSSMVSRHAQPAAAASISTAADGCHAVGPSQEGQRASSLELSSMPAAQSSPAGVTDTCGGVSTSAEAAKKVSPIGVRASAAHLGERADDSSASWRDASCDGPSTRGSLSSTLRPGAVDIGGCSSQLLAAEAAAADGVTGTYGTAAVTDTMPPDPAAEQSSIVSYSFVTKITSEARKAGAASSELAAYIVRLSQQQAAAAAAARGLPLPAAAQGGSGAAAAGGVASAASLTSPVSGRHQADAKTGISRGGAAAADASLATAPGRAAAEVAVASAAPVVRLAPAAERGDGAVAAAIVRPSLTTPAAHTRHAAGPAGAGTADVVEPSWQPSSRAAGAAAVTSATAAGVTLNGMDKPSLPQQQQQPVQGTTAAAAAVAADGDQLLNQQGTFSPMRAHTSDSSWFWSSDATASSSKSLSLDFSAEDASLLKQHSGASEPAARPPTTPRGHGHSIIGSSQGAVAAAAPPAARLSAHAFDAGAASGSVLASVRGPSARGGRDSDLARVTEHSYVPSSAGDTAGSGGGRRSRDGGNRSAGTPIAGRREEAGGSAAVSASHARADLPVSLTTPSSVSRSHSTSPQPFTFSAARDTAGDDGGSGSRASSVAGLDRGSMPSTEAGAARQAALAHHRGRLPEGTAAQLRQPHVDEDRETAQLQDRVGSAGLQLLHHGLHPSGTTDDHDQCTVQVTSEVHINEVCCVGFSLQTQLEMYNPNSRWVLATLRVMNQSLDGSEEKCANSVPFILKQKARLEPKATEIIPIVFAPQKPGMYMAQLHVDTSWLVPVAKAGEGSAVQHTSTAIVNILANAELPRVEALNVTDGCINYGNVPWKCSRHFQLSLVNKGHAGIPLRLIISCLKSSSYGCFSFAPALPERYSGGGGGGVHGTGSKVIQNVLLPARCMGSSSSGIMPVDIAMTFTAPMKPYGSSNAAEVFQALLNVELDNPSAVKPLLAVKLQATVGAAKIHTPAVEGVEFTGVSGSVIQESIPIRNAGSIPFVVQFSANGEDSNAFTVVPSRTFLNPNEDFKVVVKCDTKRLACSYSKSVLLMAVEPDGPTFEVGLAVHITSAAASAAATTTTAATRLTGGAVPLPYPGGLEQRVQQARPSELASSRMPPLKEAVPLDAGMPGNPSSGDRSSAGASAVLYSNKSCVMFGGVPAGQTTEQSFNLRNVLASCVRVALDIALSSKTLAACDDVDEPCCFELVGGGSGGSSSSSGSWKDERPTKRELVLMPFEDYTVRIRFTPRQTIAYGAKLKIFCAHNGATYMVRLSGYGGTGSLTMENYCGTGAGNTAALLETRGGVWQLGLGRVAAGRSKAVVEVLARNTGSRSVFVRAVCFTDSECAIRMSTGRIVVQPEQFVLAPSSTKVISIVYSLSEKEHILCEKAAEIIGVVSLYYGDEIMRQKLKRLLKTPRANAKVKLKHRLADSNFDFYFLHEEQFDEDAYLPDDPREVDHFFASLKECRLELVGYPATGSRLTSKQKTSSEEVSMQPLMFLEDTLCGPNDIGIAQTVQSYAAGPPTRYPAERPMLDVASTRVGDDDSWTVEPTVVLLTVVKAELERQIKKVKISNNSESPLSFDISWPASYVVITPENGLVEPRSSVNLCLSARAGLSRQLPWSGCLYVMARSSAKPINIVIEEASTSASSAYIPEPKQLGSTPSLQHGGLHSSGEFGSTYRNSGDNTQYRSVRHPAETGGATQLLPVKMEVDPHSTRSSDLHSAVPSTGTRSGGAAHKSAAGESCAPGNATVYVRHKESFPVTSIGQTSTVKMTLCNRSTIEQKVSLTASPPFAVKQSVVNVRPGHFVKLPVTFRPLAAGTVQGQLVLTSTDGKKQSLTLKATCTL